MKMLRLITAFSIGFVGISAAVIGAARAAQGPAALSVLSGTWNCTSQGPSGKGAGTVTFTRVLPNLMQFSDVVTSGKNTGHKGTGEWFYDAKKGEYVAMSAGSGGWGVSRGPASADAMMVTLTDVYPSDPTNGTTTFHFASGTISFSSDWKKNGKPMHFQETCTKV
jgi:outer membrane lipoprotein-sorting protein